MSIIQPFRRGWRRLEYHEAGCPASGARVRARASARPSFYLCLTWQRRVAALDRLEPEGYAVNISH